MLPEVILKASPFTVPIVSGNELVSTLPVDENPGIAANISLKNIFPSGCKIKFELVKLLIKALSNQASLDENILGPYLEILILVI